MSSIQHVIEQINFEGIFDPYPRRDLPSNLFSLDFIFVKYMSLIFFNLLLTHLVKGGIK
ncbi:hypothetical protein NADRNF5_0220 [Nitrosopumilus adriaticus]|uniref:Uncharacterized protein n=1 Tax=Nitrosopumilus adriaticus TaxID=1580092 RepID=A0A0D5BZE7_9ARCH|nr:hypothetical protein NADRNF5_0220 [Nitrosopumilus adriaticus]